MINAPLPSWLCLARSRMASVAPVGSYPEEKSHNKPRCSYHVLIQLVLPGGVCTLSPVSHESDQGSHRMNLATSGPALWA